MHKVFIEEIYSNKIFNKFINLNKLKLEINMILPYCNHKLLIKIIEKHNLNKNLQTQYLVPQSATDDDIRDLKIQYEYGCDFINYEDFVADIRYNFISLNIKTFEYFKNIIGWHFDEYYHENDYIFSYFRNEMYDNYKLIRNLVKRGHVENIKEIIFLCEVVHKEPIDEETYDAEHIKRRFRDILELCKNYN